MKDLKSQVRAALADYVVKAAAVNPHESSVQKLINLAARESMLSGIAIAAHYLAANDGHPDVTPHALEKACLEIGRELGLEVEQLTPPNPNSPP